MFYTKNVPSFVFLLFPFKIIYFLGRRFFVSFALTILQITYIIFLSLITLLTWETKTANRSTSSQPGKMKRKPGNSQSRRLKSPSSTMKTTTSSIHKNQEKNSSHIRRFPVSQIRHLKPCSLIPHPPEGISQSRRLRHFPDSSPGISYIRHKAVPKLVTYYQSSLYNSASSRPFPKAQKY